jgi:hypothetical protein
MLNIHCYYSNFLATLFELLFIYKEKEIDSGVCIIKGIFEILFLLSILKESL